MIDSRILKRIYIFGAIGALLFGALLLRLPRVDGVRVDTDATHSCSYTSTIQVGKTNIEVAVADTPTTREKGLSGTQSLAPHTGMLFVFPSADRYGFWMKDMNYPIDIVWIDASCTVVGVTGEVSPSSYPTVLYPPAPVVYVLELPSGEAQVDRIEVGTVLKFQK